MILLNKFISDKKYFKIDSASPNDSVHYHAPGIDIQYSTKFNRRPITIGQNTYKPNSYNMVKHIQPLACKVAGKIARRSITVIITYDCPNEAVDIFEYIMQANGKEYKFKVIFNNDSYFGHDAGIHIDIPMYPDGREIPYRVNITDKIGNVFAHVRAKLNSDINNCNELLRDLQEF